jgi:hypothetical protein
LDELFEKGVNARKFSSFALERQLVDGSATRANRKDPEGREAAVVQVEDSEKR